MILRNQGKCHNCDDLIASINQHDYRTCKCGAIAVDGGTSYLRRMGNVVEESIVLKNDVSKEVALQYIAMLFALDGKSWRKTSEVMFKMKQQAKKMPWLPVPTDHSQLLRWLRKLVNEDLIDEEHKKVKWQTCYWRSKVRVAPWVNY